MKILIVDDDQTYLKLLNSILTAKGHLVSQAENGAIAWEMLQKDHHPFVITDWMMPGMNGLSLIKQIRSAEFPGYTYIVLLTARSGREDVVDGLLAGADDYLTKPFDLDELRARVTIGERIVNLESKLRETLKQLEILATYDELTDLLNRRALYEALHTEWNRARRERQPISLIMLDIDHFKNINDCHGHPTGDLALQHVARLIKTYKRSYDIVGRWGGEEFMIVLPNTDLHEAARVAERLRLNLSNTPLRVEHNKLEIKASFGVAGVDTNDVNGFDQYILYADRALYRAKNTGRNQVCAYNGEQDVHQGESDC